MKKLIKKIFGGITITWPKLIIFAILMGAWTALMAMFAPDGNSFHDIAVTGEWWMLPALFIVLNSKKPLEAVTKTIVFFLISQPLVYLIQVPFSDMGWGLFGYYKYWFMITLLTFPAAFVAWYIKEDKWYSGIILAAGTIYLTLVGVGYVYQFMENPPSHLISIIYCFGFSLILMFGLLKDKFSRIFMPIATAIAAVVYVLLIYTNPFEVRNNALLEENNIILVGEPYVSFWSGDGEGEVRIEKYDDNGTKHYMFVISGDIGKNYRFAITDSETEQEYQFKYYYNKDKNTVVIEKE